MVISPYVRRQVVDSTFYTIVSMYRTIEQILGLEPQNGFDSAGEPMHGLFKAKPDFAPRAALENQIALDEMNRRLPD